MTCVPSFDGSFLDFTERWEKCAAGEPIDKYIEDVYEQKFSDILAYWK